MCDDKECMPKKERSETFIDYLKFKDLDFGIILVNESIRESTTAEVLTQIREVKRKQLPKVTVIISSPGGGAYYALAIYDALRDLVKCGIGVEAIVEGWAASAAAMIVLQAAEKRFSRPSARFLLHETRRWVFFSVERISDLRDEVKEMEALTNMVADILAKRCNKTKDEVLRFFERKEVWMSASEAKEWGLIDEII